MNLLDKGLLAWVAKNKNTFLLVILVTANVYQYVDKTKADKMHFEEQKRLNQTIKDMGEQNLLYERQRSEKLEYLFNNLSNLKK